MFKDTDYSSAFDEHELPRNTEITVDASFLRRVLSFCGTLHTEHRRGRENVSDDTIRESDHIAHDILGLAHLKKFTLNRYWECCRKDDEHEEAMKRSSMTAEEVAIYDRKRDFDVARDALMERINKCCSDIESIDAFNASLDTAHKFKNKVSGSKS